MTAHHRSGYGGTVGREHVTPHPDVPHWQHRPKRRMRIPLLVVAIAAGLAAALTLAYILGVPW